MIPNHTRFLEAIHDRKKVSVRFYSAPDGGVLDRVCAPLDYGPGGGFQDGLNRYWLWDCAGGTEAKALGLVPQQIVELQVLGEEFDPAALKAPPQPWSVPRTWSLPPQAADASGAEPTPPTPVVQSVDGPVPRTA